MTTAIDQASMTLGVNRKFRFTQRDLMKLPACPASSASSCDEYSDQEVTGLKLQVSKTARKVFFFRYAFGGKKRVARIGEFPAIDVTEARKRALAMRAQLDTDADPQAERDRHKEVPTFRQFALDRYMPMARQTKRSHADDESKLRLHMLGRFGSRKLHEIGTHEIQSYIGDIAASHTAATANRHYALLSRMFKLATVWGLLDRNPCGGVSKFREAKKKERFLSPAEIARFSEAMNAEKNQVAASALRLLLLSGLRRNEVLRARWDQVDMDAAMMYLPQTKAGKPRHVVLNSAALTLVKNLPSRGRSQWLFPQARADRPIDNPTKAFLRLLEKAGIERIRIHDLRHSFASTAINAGASLFEVQALLGHSSPQMTMRYAHLAQDTIRRASESVAGVFNAVTAAPSSRNDAATTPQ